MATSLDKVFEALASSPRRQILAYLSEAELSTTELAERFAMSAPAISRHLSVLENAGLVRQRAARPVRPLPARPRQPGQQPDLATPSSCARSAGR
jgi:DNA-binding transcriptional ArsR family regulator